MEEKPLFGALTVYRERGGFLRRLEQFEKAKLAYDEAHNFAPEDVGTLMGRSKVCADAVQPAQAYADAEQAALLEPSNMTARFMQAQATYEMSEFEKSLVNHYRGYVLRKQPPYFKNGINMGLETIEDCVGVGAGDVLGDMADLIIKTEEARNEAGPEENQHVSRIPLMEEKQHMREAEVRKLAILARVMAMKYLGPMSYDKFFLKEKILDDRIESANKGGSAQLQELLHATLATLELRQDMLRTRRPFYTIKLAEAKDTERIKKVKAKQLKQDRKYGKKMCEKLMQRVADALETMNAKEMMSAAERYQLFLDTKTPRTLPNKYKFTELLYRYVAEGLLRMYRIDYDQSDTANERRADFLMGLPVSRFLVGNDPVICTYPRRLKDPKKANDKFLARLELEENPFARCFLYHELAFLALDAKNYSLSKLYSKKCQRGGLDCGCNQWWFNATFILISSAIKQGNTNEARVTIDEVEAFARDTNETRLLPFLEICHAVAISGRATGGGEDAAVKKREAQILSVMEDEEMVRAQQIFKTMWRVPAGRRFSVLPRKSDAAETKAVRKQLKQRGLTIVPGPEVSLPEPPKTSIVGFQIFDLYGKAP